MARSGIVFGSQTKAPPAVLSYFWPGAGLVTGVPPGSTGTQAGSALVANGLAADGWPFRPTVLTPATNPISSGVDGPRLVARAEPPRGPPGCPPAPTPISSGLAGPGLVAPDELPSYPAPAADGRGWKYCGSGFPWRSVNSCPSSADPTSRPREYRSEPFAWLWKNSWARPVTISG